MARRVPVYELQRRLDSAKKAEIFYARPDRNPVKTTVDKRPKSIYGYRSIGITLGATTALVELQVSDASVVYFGTASALKLIANTGTLLDDAIPKPAIFKPSRINAVVGDPTPTVKTSRATGNRYIKYSATAAANAQSAYSAPVGATGTSGTLAEQEATARAIATAKKASVGDYGRISFIAETSSTSLI
jgi:hypothetical protein